jgi:hypothetical protein
MSWLRLLLSGLQASGEAGQPAASTDGPEMPQGEAMGLLYSLR